MDVVDNAFMLRARGFWECLDLGTLMFRRWFVPIMLCFGLPLSIAALVLLPLCEGELFWLPMVALWYLKPLWSRLVIVCSGILFFDPHARGLSLFKALGRIFSPRLLAELSYKRFSWWNAYLCPVDMFEWPAKLERPARRSWLIRPVGGQLFALSVVFLLLEVIVFFLLILSFQAIGLADVLVPGMETPLDSAAFNLLCAALSLLFVQPMYSLAAFCLYLNQRTIHEAWDIKLAFQRLLNKSATVGKVVVMLALAGAFLAFAVPSLPAETVAGRLDKVLESPDFGGEEQRQVLQLREMEMAEVPDLPEMARPDMTGVAEILRVVVIILGVGLLVLLVVLLIRRVGPVGRSKLPKAQVLVEDKEDLVSRPAPLLLGTDQSLAAWQAGDQRLALACLYHGILAAAGRIFALHIPESATEGQCERLVRAKLAPGDFVEAFIVVSRLWVRVSWSAGSIEEREYYDILDRLRQLDGGRR